VKVWRLLARIENIAMLIVLAGLITSVLMQVMSRYALGDYLSLAWTDEVARGLVAWLTFIGAILLDRDDEHIHVTIVIDLLGPRARQAIGVLTDLMCLAFLALVFDSALGSVEADSHSTMVSAPIPMTAISGSLLIAAALMFVHVARRAVRRILALARADHA
jgi:TRAP-type C4-dicarboxylate transport system permease small subunit